MHFYLFNFSALDIYLHAFFSSIAKKYSKQLYLMLYIEPTTKRQSSFLNVIALRKRIIVDDYQLIPWLNI